MSSSLYRSDTLTAITVSSDRKTITFTDNNVRTSGFYNYGLIVFNPIDNRHPTTNPGGLNHELGMEIKTHTISGTYNATITLVEPMPYNIVTGIDTFKVFAGCDRRAITCRAKFNNLTNFRGEPYVPGNDYLLTTGRPPS